jgi:hypothetical protein
MLSGAIVQSVAKLASITVLSLALSYWIDYLGFITEEKLAVVLITPSLGVPNWSVIYIINTAPSLHSYQRREGNIFSMPEQYQGPVCLLVEYKGNNKYGREKIPKPKVS